LLNKALVNQRDKNYKAWSVGVYMPDRPFSALHQVQAVMRVLGLVSSTFVNVFLVLVPTVLLLCDSRICNGNFIMIFHNHLFVQ
jgi:hypothetical protein